MGVDTSPLVLYCIYLQEGTHSESAIKVIEGQVVGAFHGKVTLIFAALKVFQQHFI